MQWKTLVVSALILSFLNIQNVYSAIGRYSGDSYKSSNSGKSEKTRVIKKSNDKDNKLPSCKTFQTSLKPIGYFYWNKEYVGKSKNFCKIKRDGRFCLCFYGKNILYANDEIYSSKDIKINIVESGYYLNKNSRVEGNFYINVYTIKKRGILDFLKSLISLLDLNPYTTSEDFIGSRGLNDENISLEDLKDEMLDFNPVVSVISPTGKLVFTKYAFGYEKVSLKIYKVSCYKNSRAKGNKKLVLTKNLRREFIKLGRDKERKVWRYELKLMRFKNRFKVNSCYKWMLESFFSKAKKPDEVEKGSFTVFNEKNYGKVKSLDFWSRKADLLEKADSLTKKDILSLFRDYADFIESLNSSSR